MYYSWMEKRANIHSAFRRNNDYQILHSQDGHQFVVFLINQLPQCRLFSFEP